MDYLKAIENGALAELPELRLLIWTKSKSSNNSRFFATIEEAWTYCEESKRVCDVYSSLGLRHCDLPKLASASRRDPRGGEFDIRALLGLALEFDVDGEERAKSNLFSDVDEITGFIDSLPLRPSMLVFSGGGVHAYWLFRECWELEDEKARLEAKSLSFGWHTYVASRSTRKIDSTYSLDRVYRVAGTVNHKYGDGIEVSILDGDGPRYNPSDFQEWKTAVSVPTGQRVLVAPSGELSDKVKNLILFAPEFADVWHHTAQRLRGKSQSEFDLSLANLLKDAGLGVDEIASAISVNRKISGASDKPPGYYSRTLEKAGVSVVVESGDDDSNDDGGDAGPDKPLPDPGKVAEADSGTDDDDPKSVYFATLSQAVGLRVGGIDFIDRGQGHESFIFSIHLASGAKVPVTRVAMIRSLANWKNIRTTYPPDQIPLRELGKNAWEELISKVLTFAENVTIDEDTVEMQMLLEIHHYFLQTNMPTMDGKDKLEFSAFIHSGNPFMYAGGIYFSIPPFRRWYSMNVGKFEEALALKTVKEVGFERKRLVGRRWWKVGHNHFVKLVGADNGEENEEGDGSEGGAVNDAPGSGLSPGAGTGNSPYHRNQHRDDSGDSRGRGVRGQDQLN